MRYVLAVVIVLYASSSIHADTLKVPGQYPTIQAAIDAASDNDIVLVAPGTYAENIDFLGKAIQVTSSEGKDQTLIDGGQMGSVVTFHNVEGPDSVLDGFTITNGSGVDPTGYGYYYGGGIHCSSSSPRIASPG